MKTPEAFMQYFRHNYPGPRTTIVDPDWHAPKIYQAAINASAYADLFHACEFVVPINKRLSRQSRKPGWSNDH